MDYFKKYDKNPAEDLKWNIPERKHGAIVIVGGNAQNFHSIVKTAEWAGANYPLEDVKVILPDVLKNKLPPVPGLVFLASTESGSLADGEGLVSALSSADYGILLGDLSKNSTTGQAVAEACKNTATPLIVTRDTVDLLADNIKEEILMNENLTVMASVAQLQKLLRAIYYPKILTLTQPLTQVAEVLHKFTLSYPVNIVTLHNGQVLVAGSGVVKAMPLEKSPSTRLKSATPNISRSS